MVSSIPEADQQSHLTNEMYTIPYQYGCEYQLPTYCTVDITNEDHQYTGILMHAYSIQYLYNYFDGSC